ncbi:MAG: DAK2 domain-containing protein [Bacilli bacterium]|nr:DAK2 domain-containing protein [Bacilli bacterium]
MVLNKINGQDFKNLITFGAKNLRLNFKEVDDLNVFPVPDGDTGTNMCHTIEGGVDNIRGIESNNLSDIAKPLSSGALLGARGNSGVILSQIIRGICKGLSNKKEVTALELVEAYKLGVKQAYGAVVTPVEGTILTVFREATEHVSKMVKKSSSINDFYQYHFEEAKRSLARTIDILPVLKEAGVIDSGGAGYVYIVEGMLKYLNEEEIKVDESSLTQRVNSGEQETKQIDFSAFGPDDVLQFGYCTEFILRLQNSKVDIEHFDIDNVINILNGDDIKGDSIVALVDDSVLKVHVHTMNPGIVLDKMRQFGEFLTIKIENMALQHNENIGDSQLEENRRKEHKKYTVVAVGQGEGIVNAFKELGVDVVISGGQTMNPSTENFINAFKSLDAENIIVFPNNSNIFMAASQAAKLYKGANVEIVKTKSIAECYSALTMLDFSSDDLTIILGNFREVIDNVTSGEVTTATRDTNINGIDIKKGDYITLIDGDLVSANKDRDQSILKALENNKDIEDKQVLLLIYGENVNEGEVEELITKINDLFPYLEVGAIPGNQAIYDYYFSLE